MKNKTNLEDYKLSDLKRKKISDLYLLKNTLKNLTQLFKEKGIFIKIRINGKFAQEQHQ